MRLCRRERMEKHTQCSCNGENQQRWRHGRSLPHPSQPHLICIISCVHVGEATHQRIVQSRARNVRQRGLGLFDAVRQGTRDACIRRNHRGEGVQIQGCTEQTQFGECAARRKHRRFRNIQRDQNYDQNNL